MTASKSIPWNVPHLAAGAARPTIDPDQVTLYNMRFCPYGERAVLVLLAKKIPFKMYNINLKKKPDFFLAESTGTVPVIQYRGETITESLIVADYLDEMFPWSKLSPTDPAQKAKDRIFLEEFPKYSMGFYKALSASNEEDREKEFKGVCAMHFKMEENLTKRGTPFFGGDQPGMLDYMIWPWFERVPILPLRFKDLQLPSTAGLNAWQERMWRTGPVSRYGLSAEDHNKFFLDFKSAGEEVNYDFLLE